MKKLQTPLRAVLKTLASLTKKVEAALEQFEAGLGKAAKPVGKAKAPKAVKASKAVKAPRAAKAVKAVKAAKAVKAPKAVKASKAAKAPRAAKASKAVKAAKAVKAPAAAKASAAVKAPAAPPAETSESEAGTVLDIVLDTIKKAKNGASIEMLKTKTNLEARQLSNALYKLTKKGAIEARARGIYFKK